MLESGYGSPNNSKGKYDQTIQRGLKTFYRGRFDRTVNRLTGVVAYQDIQTVADGPSGFNNVSRNLVRDYKYIWIGASIARLHTRSNERYVVRHDLKPGLEKGSNRRRTGECERVCNEGNWLGQFASPILKKATGQQYGA